MPAAVSKTKKKQPLSQATEYVHASTYAVNLKGDRPLGLFLDLDWPSLARLPYCIALLLNLLRDHKAVELLRF